MLQNPYGVSTIIIPIRQMMVPRHTEVNYLAQALVSLGPPEQNTADRVVSTTEIYFLSLLEAGSLRSWSERALFLASGRCLHSASSWKASSGVPSSSFQGTNPILRSPLNLIILQRSHVHPPLSVRALTYEFGGGGHHSVHSTQ